MAPFFPLLMCLHMLFAALIFAGLILLVLWSLKQPKETQVKTITWLLIIGIVGVIATSLFSGHVGGTHPMMKMRSHDGMMKGEIMKDMKGMSGTNMNTGAEKPRMPSLVPATTNSNTQPVTNANNQ